MNASGFTLVGTKSLRRALEGLKARDMAALRRGLIAAGLFLEGAATRKITNTIYAVPEPKNKPRKRTGNLRASRFTTWEGHSVPTPAFHADKGNNTPSDFNKAVHAAQRLVRQSNAGEFFVLVGYGASYALYMHEGTRVSEGFKWLQDAATENVYNIRGIVRREFAGGAA